MTDHRLDRLLNLLARCGNGTPAPPSTDALSHEIGCRNRHELNRLLRRNRMPTPRAIRALARILQLHSRYLAVRSGYRAALALYTAPEWLYRSCRRVIGTGWAEVRSWSAEQVITTALERNRGTPGPDSVRW